MFIMNQPPYPIESFPLSLQRVANELATNVQVTSVIAGTSCLTALSVALSPLVDWKHPLSGKTRPCTLYQAIAAISGDRKSSAEAELLPSLYAHDSEIYAQDAELEAAYKKAQARWAALYKRRLGQYAKLMEAGKGAEAEALLSAIEAQEPVRKRQHRLVYTDVTKLSIFEALEGDGKAVALLTDEGQTLLSSTVMRHYGFLNGLWEGKQVLSIDRADHKHLIARNPRLTISFMIQPDVLIDFFTKRGSVVKSSGLWARFLFSRSPSIQGHRPPRLSFPMGHLGPFHARLLEFLLAYKEMLEAGRVARDVLEFDEQAKLYWLQIAGNVEASLRPGQFLHDISDFGNKYMDIVGRIACLLHYVEVNIGILPADTEARTRALGMISAETLRRAEQIATWHMNEYKQMFSPPLQRPPEEVDADRVYAYLYRNFYRRGVAEVVKNHVRQYCGVRNSARLNSALQILAGRQAVFVGQVVYGGSKKPTDTITLNMQYFSDYPVC